MVNRRKIYTILGPIASFFCPIIPMVMQLWMELANRNGIYC